LRWSVPGSGSVPAVTAAAIRQYTRMTTAPDMRGEASVLQREHNVAQVTCVVLALFGMTSIAMGQHTTALSSFEFSTAASAARGVQVGAGRGVDFGVRWQPRRLGWMAIVGTVNVSTFDRTLLRTSSADLLPQASGVPVLTHYSLGASSVSGVIGPEIARPAGKVRPYLHALGGLSEVKVTGDYLLSWIPGTVDISTRPTGEPYAIDSRRASAGTLFFGAGVRLAVSRGLRIDLGTRRTVMQSTSWMSETLFSIGPIDQSLPPVVQYTRRLDAWIARLGVSYSP
jgi:hypothetical protein